MNEMQNGKKRVGPIMVTVVVIVLVILGALYFWGSKLPVSQTSPETSTASVASVSPSDEIGSIQSDLNASSSLGDLTNGL